MSQGGARVVDYDTYVPVLRDLVMTIFVREMSGVVGAWLLARAWQVAGILLPGTRSTSSADP